MSVYTLTRQKECYFSENGKAVEETEFGINDTAFFDENTAPLLYTTYT